MVGSMGELSRRSAGAVGTDGSAAPGVWSPGRRRGRARTRRAAAWAAATLAVVVLAPMVWVQLDGRRHVHDARSVPARTVAIVLGAGLRPDGSPSTYLGRRLDAAADLYARGVVQVVLVTGDASRENYDETTAMAEHLIAAGVPADRVIRDFAGLDTHDSAVRAATVFGVRDAVVVTQDYHVPRAVFSARHAGIDAVGVGVSAASVEPRKARWYQVRELLASWRAAWDAVTGREPARPWSPEPQVDDVLAATSPR